MKRGAPLVRRTPLVARTPLRTYKSMLTNTALTTRVPLRSRTPIAPVSAKRKTVTRREYLPRRAAFLELHPICQHCSAARSVDVDHVANRSQSSTALLDESNWQALCRSCHDGKGSNGVRSVPGWQYRQELAS